MRGGEGAERVRVQRGMADTKEWEIKHCVQYAVYILPLVEGSEETAKGGALCLL